MEKVFFAKRENFPSTERLMQAVFSAHYGIRDARIVRGENGKPFLEGNALFFSVSHTEKLYFVAVSEENIGIDAEPTDREIHLPALLSRFPAAERSEIADKADFLRHWTARESGTKWMGGTLADAFSRLSYSEGRLYYRALPLPVNVSLFEREGHIVALCREKGSADVEFIPFGLL